MALEGVPWMIGGGQAVHSADVGRQLAFMASTGATGINLPGDLRVTALPTPGAAVRILPGGGPIANTYPGGAGQAYVTRNPSATDVAIPATDSTGGAVRFVIVRIDDPQYGGQAPADPAVGPYVRPELVGSLSGIAYPHMALARIDQPASTATITAEMLTDLREIANPREKSVVIPRPVLYGDAGQLTLTYSTSYPVGEYFPNVGGPSNNGAHLVDVPSWATRMQIRAEWLQVIHGADAGYGLYWVTYGPTAATASPEDYTQAFRWNATSGSNYRTSWALHEEVAVPADWRGTAQNFVLRAMKAVNSGPGGVKVDADSGVVLSVRFMQEAGE